MKVYIIYDRYECNEWFSVDYIGTRKSDSIKEFKEKCLPEFLEYGPDDCHSYQLQVVNLTKKQYEQLLEWDNDPNMSLESGPYYDFMCEVYEQCDWSDTGNVLLSTDGCSDFYEIVRYYSVFYKNKDVEEVSEHEWLFTDEYDEFYEELTSDDELCEKVIKEYVRDTY